MAPKLKKILCHMRSVKYVPRIQMVKNVAALGMRPPLFMALIMFNVKHELLKTTKIGS